VKADFRSLTQPHDQSKTASTRNLFVRLEFAAGNDPNPWRRSMRASLDLAYGHIGNQTGCESPQSPPHWPKHCPTALSAANSSGTAIVRSTNSPIIPDWTIRWSSPTTCLKKLPSQQVALARRTTRTIAPVRRLRKPATHRHLPEHDQASVVKRTPRARPSESQLTVAARRESNNFMIELETKVHR